MQIFWVDEETKAQGQPRFTKVKKKKSSFFLQVLKNKEKINISHFNNWAMSYFRNSYD